MQDNDFAMAKKYKELILCTVQQKNKIARYRTIKQCLQVIKEIDHDTAITEWNIRQLCKEDKVLYYKNGNKSLVCLDSLLEFLNRGLEEVIE